MTCKGCEHFGSDSCRDTMWYICCHDDFNIEGKCLDPDCKIPDWCPKKKRGENERQKGKISQASHKAGDKEG